ncbi:MAG: retroviral-like aspartic protease family protein [Pseudomonadota bacterium]
MRWKFFVLCLVSVFFFAAAGRAQTPLAEVPYAYTSEGWITIPVSVNGQPGYDFIFDTGATLTVAYDRLAKEQDFQPVGRDPIRVLGLIQSRYLPPYELGEISIGAESLKDHVGVVLPDWPAPLSTPHGVLGLDFMSRYTVLFDHQRRVISFYERGSLRPAKKQWRLIQLNANAYGEDTKGLLQVTARFRGERVRCLLDIGSASTVINNYAYRALTGGVSTVQKFGRGAITGSRLHGVFGEEKIVRYSRISNLRMGRARWRNPIVAIYDADIFEELGVDRQSHCLIGADLFKDKSFILDFSENTLYISK